MVIKRGSIGISIAALAQQTGEHFVCSLISILGTDYAGLFGSLVWEMGFAGWLYHRIGILFVDVWDVISFAGCVFSGAIPTEAFAFSISLRIKSLPCGAMYCCLRLVFQGDVDMYSVVSSRGVNLIHSSFQGARCTFLLEHCSVRLHGWICHYFNCILSTF
jgi:hypothetical protein